MNARSRLFLLAAVFILGGCYKTEQPFLADGDKVPLTGSFICTLRDTDINTSYSEHEGVPTPSPLSGNSASYSYSTNRGELLQAKKVHEDLYVVQLLLADSKGEVIYMYYEFIPGGFLILEEAHPEAELLANQYRVNLTNDSAGIWKITGAKSDIPGFLMHHDESVLSPIGRCTKSS